MPEELQNPTPKWRGRIQALRNLPPVLKSVWEAAPRVIAAELEFRIVVALIPVAVIAVARLIIDGVDQFRSGRGPLPESAACGTAFLRSG